MTERKAVRLKDWDYGSPGVYFITVCAKERKPLFGRVVGGGVLDAPTVALTPEGMALRDQIADLDRSCADVTVDALVIMPNHVHILLRVEEGPSGTPAPTSRANQTVPRAIAAMKRLCNRKCGRQLFQRGFYDHIIRDQDDYDRVRVYMAENPAKWVEDPEYVQ